MKTTADFLAAVFFSLKIWIYELKYSAGFNMDDKEFALNVIWENYIDVIKINVVSGSYKFLKTPDTFTEFSDIFTFFENSENLSQIYEHSMPDTKPKSLRTLALRRFSQSLYF